MLKIENLSTDYQVKRLTNDDLNKTYALVQTNSSYFNFCPPQPTRHSLSEDMTVVPADKTLADKVYVGFFEHDSLVAVLDLIYQYPNEQSAWIGFFMVDAKYEGKGIGSKIMTDVAAELKRTGLKLIELDYPKGFIQSEHFLLKNDFIKDGREIPVPGYTVVVMGKEL